MRAFAVVVVAAFVIAAGAGAGAAPGADALVVIRQTGGFIGIDRSVAVLRSGEVRVDDRHVATLAASRLAALRLVLDATRWRALRAHYAPKVHVSDGYQYAIRYRARTVRIDQGARLPPRLARAFAMLRALAG